ncbi:hypothetical protein PALB_14060 [Pseudoalteromonas luteoviolacea B = ATCC 29581]|nr:hypothetical protein PALB_14060 [Pseudoalteromonas luteoviolacea B = ATCC 29581]
MAATKLNKRLIQANLFSALISCVFNFLFMSVVDFAGLHITKNSRLHDSNKTLTSMFGSLFY